MYQEPRIDRAALITKNVKAVLAGLSELHKIYLRRPVGGPAPVLDDAQSLADLELVEGIAQRAVTELRYDKALNEDSTPDYLRVSLEKLVQEIRRVSTGHERLPGRKARAAVGAWLQAESDVREAFEDLRWRLATQLAVLDAEAAALLPKPPAPKVPPTDQQVLTEQLGRVIGRPAPAGTEPTVRAYLVIGGVLYRGDNDGRTVSDATKDLLEELVTRLEKWTVSGCAEVHALDVYARSRNLTTADQIRHAFTRAPGNVTGAVIGAMDAEGRSGRYWVKRTPCDNCSQWLPQLGITPDTTGAKR